MSALKGSFSLTRFKILGAKTNFALSKLIPLLNARKAGPLKLTGIIREQQTGWVAPQDLPAELADAYWDLSHCHNGDGFSLRLRVEKRRVPAALARIVYQDRLKSLMLQGSAKVLGRAARKDLLQEVRDELLTLSLPQVSFLDGYWHEKRDELWVYHGGKTAVDLLREAFIHTFAESLKLELIALNQPLLGLATIDWQDTESDRLTALRKTLAVGTTDLEGTDVDSSSSLSSAP